MNKKWIFHQPNEQRLIHYRSHYGLAEPLLHALDRINPPDVDRFLHPRMEHLSSPFSLPNAERACARILNALINGERIVIFGDYDVDGITASAVMFHGLKMMGGNVVNFIPNRLKDGYGFTNHAAVRCLSECSPNLVITVDCGINSVETVDMVQAKGIDVIVTDHHEPADPHAQGYAVVDPKLVDDPELHMLAGVGVAFKICSGIKQLAYREEYGPAKEANINSLLDIVAIGTIADVVPLHGDNRVMVHRGLQIMRNTDNVGLRTLLKQLEIGNFIGSQDISFKMGPRINAAGRLGDPADALRLFLSENELEARDHVAKLEKVNAKRKELTEECVKELEKELEASFNPETCFGIVGVGAGFHAGIVGIVAAKLMEQYNRPTIVLSINQDGIATGSCRSIPCFNMLDALHSCSDLLEKYGGHNFACGLSLKLENLDEFKRRFHAYAEEKLKGQDITPTLHITGVLQPTHLNWSFYRQQEALAPFGKDNPEPVWAMYKAPIVSTRMLGGKHLKLEIQTPFGKVDAIKFNYEGKVPSDYADIVFTLSKNTFRGKTSLQLLIEDISPVS